MIKIILISTFILLVNSGFAQQPTPLPAPNGIGKPVEIYLRDLTGKPLSQLTNYDIEGTPFLNSDFQTGRVLFTNGKMTNDVLLQFDMLNNKLYFKRDDTVLEFIDSIRDFYLQHNENNTLGVIFRSNYPPTDRNTSSTFYELIVDGKITLLKYRYKVISEYKDFNGAIKKRYDERSHFYAALPGNRIMRIKRDRKSLMDAMPEYAERIKSLTDKQKLRDDESLITLFEELNISTKN